MKKQGVKLIFLCLFLVVLSLSMISAQIGFLEGFARWLTGQVTDGEGTGSECTDTDGGINFEEAGSVYIDGQVVGVDSCEGDIAIDYYCEYGPGGVEFVRSFLPLVGNIITGYDIDDPGPTPGEEWHAATETQNCMDLDPPVSCIGGGVCGCKDGDTISCVLDDNLIPCPYGEKECDNGKWGQCIGFDGCDPNDEVCVKTEILESPGWECKPKVCEPGTCTDCNVPNQVGICAIGCQQCPDGSYLTDCQQLVFPGDYTETCDGKDNDCNGETDEGGVCGAGCTDDSDCSSPTPRCDTTSGNCVECLDNNDCDTGEECQNNICAYLSPTCTDLDGDGYGNPGSSKCSRGSEKDCDDDNSNDPAGVTCPTSTSECSSTTSKCAICINPGEDEVCGDGVDNNCKDGVDENCETCTDADDDGYGVCPNCGTSKGCEKDGEDCDDSDEERHPGFEEICDNKDNDCDNVEDDAEGVTENSLFRVCGPSFVGVSFFGDLTEESIILLGSTTTDFLPGSVGGTSPCNNGKELCIDGVWGVCNSNVTWPEQEKCGDLIDNDCDGSIDEDCGECEEGATMDCGDVCTPGVQTCTNEKWGTCVTSGTNPNCECKPGATGDVCGSSIGICKFGLQICSDQGRWYCDAEIMPGDKAEVCDGEDNDCDGSIDEGCLEGETGGVMPGSSQTTGLSSQGATGTQSQFEDTKEWNFLDWLFGLLTAIFRVAGVMMGNVAVSPTSTGEVIAESEVKCWDSDGGINYNVQGTGSGLDKYETEVGFSDFCYEEEVINKVDTCGGEACYLKEFYCDADGTHIKSESKVTCEQGCSNGACVPVSVSGEECLFFNKDLWKWENYC